MWPRSVGIDETRWQHCSNLQHHIEEAGTVLTPLNYARLKTSYICINSVFTQNLGESRCMGEISYWVSCYIRSKNTASTDIPCLEGKNENPWSARNLSHPWKGLRGRWCKPCKVRQDLHRKRKLKSQALIHILGSCFHKIPEALVLWWPPQLVSCLWIARPRSGACLLSPSESKATLKCFGFHCCLHHCLQDWRSLSAPYFSSDKT